MCCVIRLKTNLQKLVEDVCSGAVVLNDWNNIKRRETKTNEPSIYLNYFASPTGKGLSVSEYREYVEAMECAMYNRTLPNGMNIVNAVDSYFKTRTGTSAFMNSIRSSVQTSRAQFSTSQNQLLNDAVAQGATEIRFMAECGWECGSRGVSKHTKNWEALRTCSA